MEGEGKVSRKLGKNRLLTDFTDLHGLRREIKKEKRGGNITHEYAIRKGYAAYLSEWGEQRLKIRRMLIYSVKEKESNIFSPIGLNLSNLSISEVKVITNALSCLMK
jgi:hypothetical protein